MSDERKIPCDCPKGGMDVDGRVCQKCDGTEWIEPDEPCSTCGGLGTVPVLEHHSGPNLPPGGFDDVGDETQPCPDCKLS